MTKKASNLENIKKLRDETGAGVLEIKKALEDTKGNYVKAKDILVKKGMARAAKKSAERTASDGLVYAYIHNTGKVGSMVAVACETDFVAKTDQFSELCKDLAMQVCTGDYSNVEELLADEFIKDPKKKISDLVTEAIAKTGEKIEIKKFVKYSIND